MLSANYQFQRCDGDLAVFQELKCAPQYQRHIRYWIKEVLRLDCFLGYAVHDPGERISLTLSSTFS